MHLQRNWEFRQNGTTVWMPATVPGCVHTDLIQNKKIEDPYFRTNESKQQWIGEKDWEYRTRFDLSADMLKNKYLNLVLEGLDTYADVFLNGERILDADNMHRTWKIACKDKLKPKDNILHIFFHSVFKNGMALKESYPIPLFQYANNDQTIADSMISIFVRKAGYHFGWDWGPRFITAGIWKPISIEAFNEIHLDGLQISTQSISKAEAGMHARMEVFSDSENNVDIMLSTEEQEVHQQRILLKKGWNDISFNFSIKNPRLWWSNGLGEANLYRFNATIKSKEKIESEKEIQTGIRTLRVVHGPDKNGKSLYIELNGRPVFMKGANYIPMDM
ncbi:MAG: hypothetical protein MUE71_03665, partial [Chitinophagaceae bacterium]|nr:hypothetical protein [Chitinophagaceae bacterium]